MTTTVKSGVIEDGAVTESKIASNAVTAGKIANSSVTTDKIANAAITAAKFAAGAVFDAGTVMLFVQTAAPTGWTKSTAHNNKALRIVSGTASSGGSVAFTTAFASQAVSGTVGSTTLTTAMIPSHTHTLGPNLSSTGGSSTFLNTCGGGAYQATLSGTGATGGGGSHNHSFTGTAINLAVQYVDAIIATKD